VIAVLLAPPRVAADGLDVARRMSPARFADATGSVTARRCAVRGMTM